MIKKKLHSIKLILIFILFVACSNELITSLPASGEIDLIKTLGGSKNDGARSVIKTIDGGYAVLGFTQSIDGDIADKQTEQFDYWLLKFNANNELQWQKTYGGSKDDRGEKVIQTSDNGYALIGYSKSDDEDATENAGFQDIWVLKLDADGNISWQKSIGFSGADQGLTIIQTSDGGFFIGGILDVTASGGLGNNKRHAGGDYWGLKLDINGETEWRRFFGGTNTDTCYDVIETNDGFLLIGSSDSIDVDINNSKGGYDYWIVKIDKAGTLIWEKSLGGNEIDISYSIQKTNDGNFILAGETRSSDQDVSNQNGAADVWVIKMDPEGNIIWEKTYGGTSFDVARSITSTRDNGFVIIGSSRSSDIDVTENNGQNDAWILKINSDGKLLWQKSVGGTDIDFAYGVMELQDQSIIVVGDTNSSDIDITENKGFTDLLIIRIK